MLTFCRNANLAGPAQDARREGTRTPTQQWPAPRALELSGKYEHVTFICRTPDDLSVTLNIGRLVVGATHGHGIGSPDKMSQWLAGQALGRHCAGEADILFSGHFHTYRSQDLGGGRTWFMVPPLDNGRPFYRNKKGTDSVSGMVSVELLPGTVPGWRAPVLHV